MTWIKDISVTITPDLPVWPGDARPVVELESIEENGAVIHVTSIRIGAHTGTHLDAPLHYLPHGGKVPDIALAKLMGDATVVDVGDVVAIDRKVLEERAAHLSTSRVILKSARNKGALFRKDFFYEYSALTPDGAA